MIFCLCVPDSLHSVDALEGRDHVLLTFLSSAANSAPGIPWVLNKRLLSKWMNETIPRNAALFRTFMYLYMPLSRIRMFSFFKERFF